ncbi:cytochrome b5, partial [Ramicandelaber brevisporus]
MSSKLVTIAEVAKHSKKSDLWVIISNKVYDVTKFVDEHPGGEEVINELAGADATEGFEDVGHSEDARDLLKEYYVGDLDTAS